MTCTQELLWYRQRLAGSEVLLLYICHLVRVFRKKKISVDCCRLQGEGNKAKSTRVGGLSIKARSFPLAVQGSRTGIRSLSTFAWPTVGLRLLSSSSFVLLEFDAADQVWVKIVNTAIRLAVVYLE